MQVHRYSEWVAVHLTGKTVYLTTDEAAAIGDAMIQCVDDIELNPMIRSEFKTFTIDATGER
jgi:hypothetical protein